MGGQGVLAPMGAPSGGACEAGIVSLAIAAILSIPAPAPSPQLSFSSKIIFINFKFFTKLYNLECYLQQFFKV